MLLSREKIIVQHQHPFVVVAVHRSTFFLSEKWYKKRSRQAMKPDGKFFEEILKNSGKMKKGPSLFK